MLGYLCLALILCFLLLRLVLVSGQVFATAFQYGTCTGHRFPYLHGQKNRLTPLLDQPEVKALFTSILDSAQPRLRAGSVATVEVQFRFLFVSRDTPGYRSYPEGAWTATLVETLKNGHTIRTEFCDGNLQRFWHVSTAVGALQGLLQKVKDKKKK